MTKRVLHIFGQMYRGGAETRTMDLYRVINREEYQFDFVVMKKGRHYYFDEINQLGGKIYYVQPPNEVGYFRHMYGIYKICKENKVDVIHAHTAFNEGISLFAARLAGVTKRFAHSRSANDLHKDNVMTKVYRTVMRFLILHNATQLIGCSSDAAIYLFGQKVFDQGKVFLLPNAIDINQFGDNKNENIQIKEDHICLGTVGNLREVKNQFFLLEVFASYHKINTNSTLILVGDGPLKQNLISYAKKLSIEQDTLFLGSRDDVNMILPLMDVFLLPSIYEGLPGVVIEALASGVPCILSNTITKDVNLIPSMIKYVEIDYIEKWTFAINEMVLNDKLTSMQCKELLKQQKYDVNESVKLLESLYGKNL